MSRNIKILSSINPKHHIHFTSLPAVVLTGRLCYAQENKPASVQHSTGTRYLGFLRTANLSVTGPELSKWITSSQNVLNFIYYLTEQSKNLQSCSISPFYPLIHNMQYNNSLRSTSRSVWMVTLTSRNTEVKFAWKWSTQANAQHFASCF